METKIGTKLIKRFTGLRDVSAIHMETVDISYVVDLKKKTTTKKQLHKNLHRSRQNKILAVKMSIFSYLLNLTFVLGAQKNHLIEYPQYMFWLINKKLILCI